MENYSIAFWCMQTTLFFRLMSNHLGLKWSTVKCLTVWFVFNSTFYKKVVTYFHVFFHMWWQTKRQKMPSNIGTHNRLDSSKTNRTWNDRSRKKMKKKMKSNKLFCLWNLLHFYHMFLPFYLCCSIFLRVQNLPLSVFTAMPTSTTTTSIAKE